MPRRQPRGPLVLGDASFSGMDNSEIADRPTDFSCSVSQRGCFPRPAQVCEGWLGLRILELLADNLGSVAEATFTGS
jgi:hypothetical protein